MLFAEAGMKAPLLYSAHLVTDPNDM